MYIETEQGTEAVTWDEPVFQDVQVIRSKDGLLPGQPLPPGTYDVAYVAYDKAGNTAICAFKVHVRLTSFCPPLDEPRSGTQACEKWGPGGRFLQCKIECIKGYRFSQVNFKIYLTGGIKKNLNRCT